MNVKPLFIALVASATPFFQAVSGPMGSSTTAVSTYQEPELYNHTLLGERVLAEDVVCRNRWGTPMLPDGKGGYSLIAPINPEYIAQSKIIPPLTDGPVYVPSGSAASAQP